MTCYIHTIQTAVPENFYTQDFAREFMKTHVGKGGAVARMLHRIYAHSGIEKRHCVIPDFADDAPTGHYFDKEKQEIKNPGTGTRNEIYTHVAKDLYIELAQKTVAASEFEAKDVTHVITVSCTGFFAPGPDFYIVKALGLPPSTRRYHIGFMGCYAAFPAMRLAQSICAEDPDAVVLIACVELCTIHLQFTTETDALISASVFADGGSAAILSAKKPSSKNNALAIHELNTTITPTGEEDMAWTIGDNGFDMILSTYVPDIIQSNLNDLLAPYLNTRFKTDDFAYWAVHPGGRAIVDKVQQSLGLADYLVEPSRETLRNFGNMSSATILFVLKNILDRNQTEEKPVIGMAFGPGLTVETGIFNIIPAQSKNQSKTFQHAAVSA